MREDTVFFDERQMRPEDVLSRLREAGMEEGTALKLIESLPSADFAGPVPGDGWTYYTGKGGRPRRKKLIGGKMRYEDAPQGATQKERSPVEQLRRAVHDSPGDTSARRVYADALEERNGPGDADAAKAHRAHADLADAGEGKPVHGRLPRGKETGFTRPGRNSVAAGETFRKKGGLWVVTSVQRSQYVREDDIEDQDAWASYPEGPGYYTYFRAVPVLPTKAEEDEEARKAAKKAAQESAAAAARKAEADAWAPVGNLPQTYSWPDGLPEPAWREFSSSRDDRGYGTTRWVGTLPSGQQVGKVSVSSYDDGRTWYHVPQEAADEVTLAHAAALGMTAEKAAQEIASARYDYERRAAQEVLDALSRSSQERREAHARAAASMARAVAADPGRQLEEVQRHYRETGQKVPRYSMPDGARNGYDALTYAMERELDTRIPDREVWQLLRPHQPSRPDVTAALQEAAYRGDPAVWEGFLAREIPLAEAQVAAERSARAGEWAAWYDAHQEPLREALATVLPGDLVDAGMRYVKDEASSGRVSNPRLRDPAAWAEDIKDALADEDSDAFAGHPELAAHAEGVREEAREEEERRKAANARVVVVGKTYPHRQAIGAIKGAKYSGGQWTIPASQAHRLPRGLTSEPLED